MRRFCAACALSSLAIGAIVFGLFVILPGGGVSGQALASPSAGVCQSLDEFKIRVALAGGGDVLREERPQRVAIARRIYDETPPVGPPMAAADGFYIVHFRGGDLVFAFERGGGICETITISASRAEETLMRVYGNPI